MFYLQFPRDYTRIYFTRIYLYSGAQLNIFLHLVFIARSGNRTSTAINHWHQSLVFLLFSYNIANYPMSCTSQMLKISNSFINYKGHTNSTKCRHLHSSSSVRLKTVVVVSIDFCESLRVESF